ncbi:MAG: DUF488 domain-containing protein [Okeania sp. SIO3H1]|uniref:DUF488 domain-containing protein n=1 Tax=Okeania sp. SIO1I7 TaxID=2607772 RepID=UPI0013CD0A89|nr:DUF488 domain-containing protein [Okeania sp. SIO1I7]NEN93175.1 DUF488 domain-containing protein [Okeania sp. SIO3H1]NET27218.1 DUF488 domain-containing protein [Okeania sp. SIO1I7]
MKKTIEIFTIGFTKKTAQEFFDNLTESKVKCVIDTRVNNVSQLAGFAKKKDLEYFLKVICNIEYIHILDLAPTKELLDDYKKKRITWDTYEQRFNNLISEREIEKKVSPQLLDRGCLLCSEAKPHYCHRRLVAEYLNKQWGNIKVCHL